MSPGKVNESVQQKLADKYKNINRLIIDIIKDFK